MSQYKAYPAYKDSGVEWIGQVPEHWQLRKVAWDLVMSIGWTPDTKNRRYYGGDYNWVSIADLTKNRINETGQKITQLAVDEMKGSQAPAGSLLFSYKLTIGMVALLDQPAYTNEAIAAFYPNKKINMNFWKYAVVVILPRYSRKNIYNSDLLNQELMNSARFYAPSYDEQATIAATLDRETARIDALIQKKTRFIELLKEKRQALITHAVTKGLDPNVKMKDSGIEWIGQVPEHWEVKPFKYILSAPMSYGANESAESDDPNHPRYIRITDLTENGTLREDTFKTLPWDKAYSYLLSDGDILLARSGATVGKSFLYRETNGAACFAGYLIKASCNEEKALPKYIYAYLQSHSYWEYISGSNIQSTIQNVSAEKYSSMVLPVPQREEQATIAATLDRETARIDALIGKAEQSITLLKERRSAFITAAVTGQIDLRGKQ